MADVDWVGLPRRFRGFWKLNVGLMHKRGLRESFARVWKDWWNECRVGDDVIEWWDTIGKRKVRDFYQKSGVEERRMQYGFLHYLEGQLQECYVNGRGVYPVAEIESLKQLIGDIHNHNFDAARIASGINEVLWGDRPSAFVLREQGKRRRATEIMELEVQEQLGTYRRGQLITSIEGMGCYVDAWYEAQYKKVGISKEVIGDMGEWVCFDLKNKDRMNLNGPISEEEVRIAVESVNAGKSPGIDGKQDMKLSMMRLQQTGLSTQVVEAWLVTQVVGAVLTSTQHGSYSVIFITDGTTSPSTIFMTTDHLRFPGGVGIFEVVINGSNFKQRDEHLSLLVGNVKMLRKLSSYITIVVISDEATFLAAFVKWSVKGRLMVWSTRLLILTHSRLMELQDLHTTLSNLNSMLVIINNDTTNIKCSVYVQLPYSPQESHVASWTPRRGLLFTSHLPLFPEKFSKFQHRPNLLVAIDESGYVRLVRVNDPFSAVPRFQFQGSMVKVMDYLSEALNFTYTFVRPPDGVWGVRLSNGSWTGMLGMVVREEVSIGAGPFMIDTYRSEVVDFTVPIFIDYWRILASRGLPEVDPWGFLFPLAPLVWATILGMLVVLAAAVFLMYAFGSVRNGYQNYWVEVAFGYVRILLQQDMTLPIIWLWERLLLLVWIMVTLVLTRSYSGNLMALLAVRHIPEPYQTLRDMMDDPFVTIIWEQGSATISYMKLAKSGVFREIAESEKIGRLIYVPHPMFQEIIDTLVRRGDHVFINVHSGFKSTIAQDFTKTGKCSFYESKEEFLMAIYVMIGQKDSPLLPFINKRIMSMTEAGLFFQWLIAEEPNSTVCDHVSNKITVNEALSLSNLWGMLVILLVGDITSLLVLFLEHLILHIKQI
ncbi:uncharacterized protein [Cherax quadricarinatus]|uniref:uncharacterized protein n=1 Tax=Cherax quadricarinatus TaxID=27406 RepID=UPI00387EB4B2